MGCQGWIGPNHRDLSIILLKLNILWFYHFDGFEWRTYGYNSFIQKSRSASIYFLRKKGILPNLSLFFTQFITKLDLSCCIYQNVNMVEFDSYVVFHILWELVIQLDWTISMISNGLDWVGSIFFMFSVGWVALGSIRHALAFPYKLLYFEHDGTVYSVSQPTLNTRQPVAWLHTPRLHGCYLLMHY